MGTPLCIEPLGPPAVLDVKVAIPLSKEAVRVVASPFVIDVLPSEKLVIVGGPSTMGMLLLADATEPAALVMLHSSRSVPKDPAVKVTSAELAPEVMLPVEVHEYVTPLIN